MIDSTLLLPNFNNENVLPITFSYLQRHLDCSRLNLVVVDDGSLDDSVRVLKREAVKPGFAAIDIVERPHEGIVSALNCGLEAVSTPFVFRIDGDATVISDGWVNRMKRFLCCPEIGLVGGHTLFDSGMVHSFGRSLLTEFGLFDMGAFPFQPPGQRTFDCFVWRPVSNFPGGRPYEVDTVLATCIGFRLEDARAIGGFDSRYNPVWIEDDDFGLSLRQHGLKVLVDPGIRVLHQVSLRGSRNPEDQGRQVGKLAWRDHIRAAFGGLNYFSRFTRYHAPRFDRFKGRLFDGLDDWRSRVLTSHYQYWERKWGFSPLNPDLEAIYNRYWGTELCWRINRDCYMRGRSLIRDVA